MVDMVAAMMETAVERRVVFGIEDVDIGKVAGWNMSMPFCRFYGDCP